MFRNKVVIITGAATGQGRNHAIEFAKRGANVVISDIREDKVKETAVEIENIGGECLALKVDVRSASDVERMVQEAVKKFGKIDILVNNAGVFRYGPITELSEEDWDINMDVNVKGVFLCSKYVVKQMLKQGQGGKIINISSLSGKIGGKWVHPYVASKFAVIGLTKCMALELAPHKIYVNAACPGIIFGTDLQHKPGGFTEYNLKSHGIQETDPEKIEKLSASWVPLGRVGRPDDVTKLVLFLASGDSDYITGQSINVGGGLEVAH